MEQDDFDRVFQSLAAEKAKVKALSIDFMNFPKQTLRGLQKALLDPDKQKKLDLLRMNLVDFSKSENIANLCSILKGNANIMDLHLAFCKLNDSTIGKLGASLRNNRTVVSLNINFNFLTKKGFVKLAKHLVHNNTLRYLEAKLNKANADDLKEFIRKLDPNTTIEFLDVGQMDEIDGSIKINDLDMEEYELEADIDSEPEDTPVVQPAAQVQNPVVVPNNENNAAAQNNNAPPAAGENNINLVEAIQTFIDRNKATRKQREKELKLEQLKVLLEGDLPGIYATLTHCKVLTLGPKNSGKSYTMHAIMHKLFNESKDSRLKSVSFARMSELGWTNINKFDHVEMVLGKHISNLEINKRNRMLANESLFQFAEDVVISDKDLVIKKSILRTENEKLFSKIREQDQQAGKDSLQVEETRQAESNLIGGANENAPSVTKENVEHERFVMSAEDMDALRAKMDDKIEITIEKAMREHNYPSFSIWDMPSDSAFENLFRLFVSNHGLIFVFMNLEQAKKDPLQAVKSLIYYLKPIFYKEAGNNFNASIMIIGTFFDLVLNNGQNDDLKEFLKQYPTNKDFTERNSSNYISFLLDRLVQEKDIEILKDAGNFLTSLNNLIKVNFGKNSARVIQNEEMDLLFYPMSNELPNCCTQIKEDFDDLTGLTRVRRKVMSLVRQEKLEILNEMVPIHFARVVDLIMERKEALTNNNGGAGDIVHRGNEQYMTMSEFKKMAAKCGIFSLTEQFALLNYLNETGIIFWVNYSEKLRNLIILDPDYLLVSLKQFFEVVTDPDLSKNKDLENKVKDAELKDDLKHFVALRIASQDLLLHSFINRDHFEYFFDLLVHSFSLNKVDVHAVSNLFTDHNMFHLKDEEELYLIPRLTTLAAATQVMGEAQARDDMLQTKLFSKFKLKFVPRYNNMPVGVFERCFSLLVDALKSSLLQEKNPSKGPNRKLVLNNNSALFQLDDMKMAFHYIPVENVCKTNLTEEEGESEMLDEQISYLLYEFNNEEMVKFLFQQVSSVMRKVQAEIDGMVPGFLFNTFVNGAEGWVEIKQAQRERIGPYFQSASGSAAAGQRGNSVVKENADDMLQRFNKAS